MSLYNMMNGANPATFFILPMLGEKHPEQYPRFRDCFVVFVLMLIVDVVMDCKSAIEHEKN
jgi:hypothetical protein